MKCHFCGRSEAKEVIFKGEVVAGLCQNCYDTHKRPVTYIVDIGTLYEADSKFVLHAPEEG